MQDKRRQSGTYEHKWNISGWLLFIASALFYMAASLKNGDTLSAIGSGFFLVACIVFLLPLLGKKSRTKS